MTQPPIIGICGYKGSGKSTAAEALIEIGYTRVKFADTLKNMLRCLGLTDEHLEGELKEVDCPLIGGMTPRYAMQTLGTEWGRNLISNRLWVLDWARRTGAVLGPVVTDDLRFPNEQEAIRHLGGFVLMIDRAHKSTDPHPSEDLSHIIPDHIFYNTGSIEALQTQAKHLGQNLLRK